MTTQDTTSTGHSAVAARSVIDQMTEALGGRLALESAAAEVITATGWRRHPGWGTEPSKPEAAADFTYTLVNDLSGARYQLALTGRTYLVPAALDYTEKGDGSAGHVTGVDFMFDPRPVDTAIPAWRVAARVRHFDMTSPLRLARKLTARGADVTLEDGEVDGAPVQVLVLREPGRPAARVHVDVSTGLPVRVTATEEHSPLGDTLVAVSFGDYRRGGTMLLPHQVTITVDGVPVHQETRASAAVIDTVDDTEFAVPGGAPADGSAAQMAFSQYSTEWILTYVYAGVPFYFDLQTAPVTLNPAELAPGVKIVLGPSHNTLVVEMPDYTLAVEAPLYDEYTRAALGQVKDAFPGKPLTTVVATHFHYDHIGGIREFAADGGLTLYIGEPTVPFAEAIFAAPHTTDPDRYAARPRPVTVRPVTEPVILPTADGGELRICRILSDHADDMVIVYLSGPKIVFESDLWNPTPSMPEPGAQRGRLATQLYQSITDLGLDVETVVGGHRGTDGTTLTHAAPLSYLKTAAGL
jgi:glyoxylase-like metal-dependent hydrolase (beta-lactamase superfamily II)